MSWRGVFAVDAGMTSGVSMGVFPLKGSMPERIAHGKFMKHGHLNLPMADTGAFIVREEGTRGFPVPNSYSAEMTAGCVLIRLYSEFVELVNAKTKRNFEVGVDLVIEDFTLRVGRGSSKREGLASARIAQAMEAFLYLHLNDGMEWARDPIYQSPADAKRLVTKERLKEWGLWHVGEEHARDASRHLALRVMRTK